MEVSWLRTSSPNHYPAYHAEVADQAAIAPRRRSIMEDHAPSWLGSPPPVRYAGRDGALSSDRTLGSQGCRRQCLLANLGDGRMRPIELCSPNSKGAERRGPAVRCGTATQFTEARAARSGYQQCPPHPGAGRRDTRAPRHRDLGYGLLYTEASRAPLSLLIKLSRGGRSAVLSKCQQSREKGGFRASPAARDYRALAARTMPPANVPGTPSSHGTLLGTNSVPVPR